MAVGMTVVSDFTLVGYGKLLKDLLGLGYRVCRFADVRIKAPDLILRHDIDMSMSAACEMAEFEADLDISSTYFVLVRSPLYNLLAEENARCLQKIISLGHEVGLHFDAAMYDGGIDELNRAADAECAILERFLGKPIEIISLHRPQPVLLGYEKPIAGRLHSYQPKFFLDIGYCSDSNGGWHHGFPLDQSAVDERRALQLLTHPIWWTSGQGTPQKKLSAFIETAMTDFDRALAEECSAHRKGNIRIVTGELD
jgi:hypothetical protein